MKRILILCALIGSVGILLMGTGLVFGASTSLSIDGTGIHYEKGGKMNNINDEISSPEAIDIDVASARVEVLRGEVPKIEIESSEYAPITYKIENGTLRVRQGIKFRLSFFNFFFRENTVRLYLPETVKLTSGSIRSTSGNTTIEQLNCKELELRNTSGNLTADSLIADSIEVRSTSGSVKLYDSTAERFYFHLTSGGLKADNLQSNSLTAELTSGNADISGKLSGRNEVRLISGTLKLTIDGAKSDYSRRTSVTSGNIYINGERDNSSDSNTGAANSLDISLTSGNARISFTK